MFKVKDLVSCKLEIAINSHSKDYKHILDKPCMLMLVDLFQLNSHQLIQTSQPIHTVNQAKATVSILKTHLATLRHNQAMLMAHTQLKTQATLKPSQLQAKVKVDILVPIQLQVKVLFQLQEAMVVPCQTILMLEGDSINIYMNLKN